MIRRWVILLGLVAVLLQTAQPLLAAMQAATPMVMTVPMASPAAPTASSPARCADAAAAHLPMQGHGCCYHVGWSCSGPCGAAALVVLSPLLKLPAASYRWLASPEPRPQSALPDHPLRPPIRT